MPDIDRNALNELHKRLSALAKFSTMIPAFMDTSIGETSDIKGLVDSMSNLGTENNYEPETLTEAIYDEIVPVFERFYNFIVDEDTGLLATCRVVGDIPDLAELSIKCIVMHAQTLGEYQEILSKYSKTLSSKILAQLKHIQPNTKTQVSDVIFIDASIQVLYLVIII